MFKRFIGLALIGACAVGCVSTSGSNRVSGTDPEKVVVETLAKSTRSWDGALLPVYPEGQPEVTILRITIPPGVRLPMHYHPVINAGILLSGQLTVVSEDGGRQHLHAGEALIELVNTLHYGMNEGDEPAVILVVYAGAEGMPVSVTPSQED